MISSLFAQFRHQYADGSLTTELLMTHAEQYLVKATVTIGDQLVATALAADSSLTTADDQAKLRVLAMLGFGQDGLGQETTLRNGAAATASKTAETPVPTIAQPASPPAAAPTASPSEAATLVEPDLSTPVASTAANPASDISDLEPVGDSEDIGRPIDSIAPEEAPAPSEVPASSLAADAIENFDDTHPVDLSDIIAQTDVEMSRLGWSSLQGRSYLESTFNKRSRQQLTDEELLTFLLYLETQPTPSMG